MLPHLDILWMKHAVYISEFNWYIGYKKESSSSELNVFIFRQRFGIMQVPGLITMKYS